MIDASRRTHFLLAAGASLLACAILFSPPASAAECGDAQTSIISCDAAKSGTTEANDSANNPIIAVLTFVMQILTGAVGVAAVGALIYAGILYSAASGEAGQVQKAKTIIKDTVIGLVCYGGMILILNFVIPGGVFGQSGTSGGGTKVEESGGSDDSDADSTDSEGAGTPITFVSWNSLFDNPNNVGTITKNLLKTYDVVGLQEVHETSQRNNIQAIKSATIGVYMNEDSGKYVPSYPIIYNKSKLTIVKTGFSKLGNSPDGLRPKYSIYARFRINATKQEFYFVNTHLLKYVENNGKVYDDEHPEHVSAYKKMIAKLKEQLISLKSSGVPVVIVGDFAVNYRRDACTVSWWPCATMHSMSIKSSYEHTKLAGISSSQNTYGAGSRLIDYVFVSASNDTKVTSTTILSGGGSNYQGSDHRPVTASVTFLSSSGAD